MTIKNYNELSKWIEKKKFQKRIHELSKKYEGKKVILYGAGLLASVMLDQYDLSTLNIIGVADIRFFDGEIDFKGYKAISPFNISDYTPDVILIANYNSYDVKDFLKENVLQELGKISIESIVKKNFKEKIEEFLVELSNSL
ncbi:MAG: hypothetical protein V2B14_07520 [bacterium]